MAVLMQIGLVWLLGPKQLAPVVPAASMEIRLGVALPAWSTAGAEKEASLPTERSEFEPAKLEPAKPNLQVPATPAPKPAKSAAREARSLPPKSVPAEARKATEPRQVESTVPAMPATAGPLPDQATLGFATAQPSDANDQQLVAVTSVVSTSQLKSLYEARLLAHLTSHKRYPPAARMRGLQGVATIALNLHASGDLIQVTLAQSSGVPSLDDAALSMVHAAAPLPAPPPDAYGDGPYEFAIPVDFELR